MNCIYCGEQSETEVCESCKRAGFDIIKTTTMEKTIYDLKLHETLDLSEDISVFRVPGGWIYQSPLKTIFVPYDNEFDLLKESDK